MNLPSGDRIVLNPEDLRRVVTRMRGASAMLSMAGRDLATRPMPSMPAGVEAAVTEVIARANAELQDLAAELVQEGEVLSARATWAELGGGAELAWLIPRLRYLPASLPGSEPLTPASTLPPVAEEQLLGSERWATALLDEMTDPDHLLDQGSAEVGDQVDQVSRADLIELADEYADDTAVGALGRVTMAAGVALDVYERGTEGIGETLGRAGMPAGVGAAGGAIGVAFHDAALGWTGVGLVGCLVVGSGIESSNG